MNFSIGKGIAISACVIGAVYLADHGREGWGWLIFAAIFSPRLNEKPRKPR